MRSFSWLCEIGILETSWKVCKTIRLRTEAGNICRGFLRAHLFLVQNWGGGGELGQGLSSLWVLYRQKLLAPGLGRVGVQTVWWRLFTKPRVAQRVL